jgi:Clp amino terminal domain, pathogenicity island component
MMLSERAQTLLASALTFAGPDQITPLHLLWAMLGEEQGEVAHLLIGLGCSRDRIESDIRRRALH